MGFQVGQTVSGYEIAAILNTSRIGEEYKVRNVITDRFEVMRVLPKALHENREQVDRFLREIKVHARLAHPNIVAFYNAMEIEGQVVMTTEFVEGLTLAERLEQGPIPLAQGLSYILQLLAALDCAHQHGVVHREISPANILLGAGDTVKLTGFGLAKGATDPQLTQVGTVMGWLEYMSPEQVKGSLFLDARTDLYSLGAVLYEVVTGQVPFTGRSPGELMLAHVTATPKPPSEINRDLPPVLNQVILTGLAKEPGERFQTAPEFASALENALPGLVGEIKAPAAAAPPPPPPPPPPVQQRLEDTRTDWKPEQLSRPTLPPPPPRLPPSRPESARRSPSWETPGLILIALLTFLVVAVAFFLYLRSGQ